MRTSRVFKVKSILGHFKRLSVSKNLLRLKYAFLMLWNSISWGHLNFSVQIQLALHPCDPFLVNNRIMTGNIVEK